MSGQYLSSGQLTRLARAGSIAPPLSICDRDDLMQAERRKPEHVDRLVRWLVSRGDIHLAVCVLEELQS